jgi:trehalose 6-phosphate phosphatase
VASKITVERVDPLCVLSTRQRRDQQSEDYMADSGGADAHLVAATIVERLAANLPDSLIALDFDGTIAPIVADPARAQPTKGAVEVLAKLVDMGAQVAVISGRDATTVVALSGLGGLPGLIVEGLYGAERWQAGQLTTLPTPEAITDIRGKLQSVVAAVPQLWIEDKRLSLVVHARRAPEPLAALALVDDAIRSLARSHGLEVHSGRDVLELRLPGFDKGMAMHRVVADTARTHVLFAGDDIGDIPAFHAVAELRRTGLAAWGIVVASPEVPELVNHGDLAVDGPDALLELLIRVAG